MCDMNYCEFEGEIDELMCEVDDLKEYECRFKKIEDEIYYLSSEVKDIQKEMKKIRKGTHQAFRKCVEEYMNSILSEMEEDYVPYTESGEKVITDLLNRLDQLKKEKKVIEDGEN